MRQRGDMDCLHEPFGEAWYQGEDPMWHRFGPGEVTTPGLTLDTVWQDIQRRAAGGPVFVKDFPHYINHMWTPAFLVHFTHACLIRDPALTITSMYAKWPDFHEGEVGFPEQRALFDLLWALNGSPPLVIDSGDLLENPHEITQAFCNSVEIPFIPEALTWEPGGDPSAHSWWDGGSFHGNLAKSTGLTPQKRKYVELSEMPDRVRQVYRRMKPHYDHLYAHRITL
ncbi:hypothetical protein SAMN05444000_10591 [Shimia gijangensis]|uniref:Sulfotransferase family protein n=2 Tax=Shimia gijangensis TaxID=1470563 RepID=A0A1M6GQL1_9RHOB|nr:hypothetical protein SAMN05444000_10591 [Shimia gijangensis]